MTNENETVEDIVREMRNISIENGFKDLAEWCDRIEAEYKREYEYLRETLQIVNGLLRKRLIPRC